MAPEILINRVDQDHKKKVDVYSFGIVMHEVFFETVPYRTNEESFDSIIALGTKVVTGLRPTIPEHLVAGISENEKKYLELMKECWSENPQDRPTFDQIFSEMSVMA